MVNVTVDAPLLKVALLNSDAFPGRDANVIVWGDDELKVTVAVPTDQLADVELFAHEPVTVQDSEPKEKKEAGAEIGTLPVMLTAAAVEMSAPRDKVTAALAENAYAP